MSRTLLVEGVKIFKITIPDDARVTFGPFSPPPKTDGTRGVNWDSDSRKGTLRIYQAHSSTDVIAVFSGVTSFRDISVIEYSEMVAVEEGAKVWKSDSKGYEREEKVSSKQEWIDPLNQLPAPKNTTTVTSTRKKVTN